MGGTSRVGRIFEFHRAGLLWFWRGVIVVPILTFILALEAVAINVIPSFLVTISLVPAS